MPTIETLLHAAAASPLTLRLQVRRWWGGICLLCIPLQPRELTAKKPIVDKMIFLSIEGIERRCRSLKNPSRMPVSSYMSWQYSFQLLPPQLPRYREPQLLNLSLDTFHLTNYRYYSTTSIALIIRTVSPSLPLFSLRPHHAIPISGGRNPNHASLLPIYRSTPIPPLPLHPPLIPAHRPKYIYPQNFKQE